MYAVIEQGGKQYRVAEGDRVQIDLMDVGPDTRQVELDKVLFIGDGAKSKVGTPYVAGAKVTASFASTAGEAVVKGQKLYVTHFRRRKNSRCRIGHRQKYLEVTIDKIKA